MGLLKSKPRHLKILQIQSAIIYGQRDLAQALDNRSMCAYPIRRRRGMEAPQQISEAERACVRETFR